MTPSDERAVDPRAGGSDDRTPDSADGDRTLPAQPAAAADSHPEALLDVRRLTVTYGGVTAVDDAAFTVGHAEVVGLIGPNGAGKTTCIDAVCGFVAPRRGSVTLAGRPLAGLPPHARVSAGLARTFQACELFPDLTVRENLAVAAQRRTRWSWLRDAVTPRATAASTEVDALLDRFGLGDEAEVRPDALPHGRQRIVDLARALATRPRVVLLDEPGAGLDPSETDELGEVIRGLPEDGVSVLLVDHDMGLVMRSCARIHVLDLGRVVASGPPDAVRTDPAVVAAYLGTTT